MAKKLLNEAVVRRFQSLANISPLNEMYKEEKKEEEEKMEEVKHDEEGKMEESMYEAEEEMDAPAEMEMDAGEEMGMDADMDGDLELTDEEADAIIALGKKLEAAMGDEEPEMDMEDEAPMEMDADEPEEDVMEDMLEGINYQPSKSELVNEVATRVARRLAEAQKAEKAMNEALGRKK